VQFNNHSELEGAHAFLSPSAHHWLRYSDEKLDNTFLQSKARQRGSELHDLACQCVRLGVKLSKSRKSFDRYVNDAIGYRMVPEQILFYSINAFGTADAIAFRDSMLRIHDLKTGVSPASMEQLEVYAALFCLEYNVNPVDISIELRKYQSDEVIIYSPPAETIQFIMDKIVAFDRRIEKLKEQ
jgi:hypothetical protein